MQMRHLIGFVLIPLVLLVAAWLIDANSLWSLRGSMLMPWLCSASAVAIAIVGAACALVGAEPARIPLPVIVCVVGSIMAVHAAGLIVDGQSYALTSDFFEVAAEWIGFGAVLAGAFLLPRAIDRPHGETHCRRCDHILRGLKEPRCPECGEAI